MKKVFYVIAVAALMGFSCSERAEKATGTETNAETTASTEDEYVQIQDEATDVTTELTTKVETPDNMGKVAKMNNEQFLELIWDYKTNSNAWVYKGTKPVIIDFYADWCGPCKRVAPIMDQLAAELSDEINIYKVDTDAERELAAVFGIRSIPSILFIPVNGDPAIYPGAYPKEQYEELIQKHMGITNK